MSYIMLDSCERYATSTHIGYQYPTNSSAAISRSYFRTRQNQSIELGPGGYIQQDFSVDYETVIMGAAVYLLGYPASDQLLFEMRDGSSLAIGLYIDSVGMPKVKKGSTIFAIGAIPIDVERFVYIELKVVIDDSAGMVQVWIHNQSETYTISASDQDTLLTANGIVDNIRWCGPGSGNTYITHLYCNAWESQQLAAEPFGNIEIHAYRPVQDASNVGCLPNTGITLTQTVKEITPVLGDYIYLTASDSPPDQYRLQHESFVFPNPEADQDIFAVQIVTLMANGNADSPPADADFSFFWGCGIETGNSDTQTVAANDAWLYYSQGYIENPATEAAWAGNAELNEFTWGVAHE